LTFVCERYPVPLRQDLSLIYDQINIESRANENLADSKYNVQSLVNQIQKIANEISSLGREREQSLAIIRLLNTPIIESKHVGLPLEFPNQKIASSFPMGAINGLTIAAVDGGSARKSFSGFDLVGSRASGIVMTLGASRVRDVSYYPQKHPVVNIQILRSPMTFVESTELASRYREIEELRTALGLLGQRNRHVDILLMDGTFDQGTFLSRSRTIPETSLYLRFLEKLKTVAREKGIMIGWVVKDSRLSIFSKVLLAYVHQIASKNPKIYQYNIVGVLEGILDQLMMHYILSEGERSFVISHMSETATELAQSQSRRYSFYLKTVSDDLPMRVDFQKSPRELEESEVILEEVNKLSTTISSLSRYNGHYSFPSPLVEADGRARITDAEFSIIVDSIVRRISCRSEVLPLRRERSPFRLRKSR